MTKQPGMRIDMSFKRPAKEIVEQFYNVPTANISDVCGRLFGMDARLKPLGKCKKICGVALTVKAAIADNGMFHKAISMARPGDVIVVNACGDTNHSVCGDVMYRYAQTKQIAGFVVDGSVRDVDYLQEHDFPVYAIGMTPRGPYKHALGEINTDIACGGQVVHAGDLIVGDEDGLVVVRREDCEAVLEKLKAQFEKEALMTRLIESGTWDTDSPILKDLNSQFEKLHFEINQ